MFGQAENYISTARLTDGPITENVARSHSRFCNRNLLNTVLKVSLYVFCTLYHVTWKVSSQAAIKNSRVQNPLNKASCQGKHGFNCCRSFNQVNQNL